MDGVPPVVASCGDTHTVNARPHHYCKWHVVPVVARHKGATLLASQIASQIARKRAHVVHGNDKEEQSRVVSQYLQIVEWSAAIVTAESTADWAHVPPVLHCLVVGVQVEVARPRLKSPHTQSQDDDCLHRSID
eukprot:COSAG06_NODE_6391_length_2952_cov_12.953733_2_plen_134_part_00